MSGILRDKKKNVWFGRFNTGHIDCEAKPFGHIGNHVMNLITNNFLYCYTENLSWFASHLQTLRTHPHSPKVNVSLYVTAASSVESLDTTTDEEGHGQTNIEKSEIATSPISPVAVASPQSSLADIDPEKATDLARHHSANSSTGSSYGAIKAGRPDTATLIREAVLSTPTTGRVLVAACGPHTLMRTVRDTTASLIRGDGPAVELHCEEFGW